jgi:hypothetical protein
MKVTKSNRPSIDRQFAEGLTKHFPKGASWVIGQKKYSLTEILKLLERRIQTAQAVNTAKAAWRGAVEQENALIADTESILAAVRQSVAITFDGSPDALADLGISPRKERRALTSEELVLKAKRAEATRKARHTVGPRKRLQIKGNVVLNGVPSTPAANGTS